MIVKYLPLAFYFSNYILLVFFGALILFFNVEPLKGIYIQHSGVSVPNFSDAQSQIFLSVLFLGPVFFALGYQFIKNIFKNLEFKSSKLKFEFSALQAHILFIFMFFLAIYELYQTGAFVNYYAWNVYEYWFKCRWELFQKIPFFGFVLIYRLLPLAAALCIITPTKSVKGKICSFLPYFLTIMVDFFIYQKTPIILTSLTCFGAFFLKKLLTDQNHISKIIGRFFILFFSIFFIYLLIVTAPSSTTYFEKNLEELNIQKLNKIHFFNQPSIIIKKNEKIPKNLNNTDINVSLTKPSQSTSVAKSVSNKDTSVAKSVSNKDTSVAKSVSNKDTSVAKSGGALSKLPNGVIYHSEYELTTFQYSVFTLFSRFGAVLFHYINIFPNKHAFYNFDFGQDILGFGSMPIDNYVVWNFIYPGREGAVMAPANFVFYTQGGLKTVFLAMFFLGSWVSLVWCFVLKSQINLIFQTLLGIVTILFSLQLAMDSARNLIICSYGYFWSFLFLLFLLGLSNLKFFQKNDICLDSFKS